LSGCEIFGERFGGEGYVFAVFCAAEYACGGGKSHPGKAVGESW
jgi:hypothetical protein